MQRFSGRAWFPQGIATSIEPLSQDPDSIRFDVHTRHGTLQLLDVPNLDSSAGWNAFFQKVREDDEIQFWGVAESLADGGMEVQESHVTPHGVEAILKHSAGSFVALFDPIPKVSWRRRWSQLEEIEGVLRCTGGVQADGRDVVVLRHFIEGERRLAPDDIDHDAIDEMGAALGRFHTAMAHKAGPRMAEQWNARLARLERISGSGTLWRAPHSGDTRSIWSCARLGFSDWTRTEAGLHLDMLRIGCEPLGELVDQTSRFPALRDVALLHSEIDERFSSEPAGRLHAALFESWRGSAPARWTSNAALDGNRGGAMIWRYDVELVRLLEIEAFTALEAPQREWLSGVRSIQRRLFNRRTIPALGLSALLITAFCAVFLDIPTPAKMALLAAGVLSRVMSQIVYRRTAPPPY